MPEWSRGSVLEEGVVGEGVGRAEAGVGWGNFAGGFGLVVPEAFVGPEILLAAGAGVFYGSGAFGVESFVMVSGSPAPCPSTD